MLKLNEQITGALIVNTFEVPVILMGKHIAQYVF